jgi:hypothetical protein
MTRITYGYGYKSRQRAQEALEDMLAHGEVSMSERPPNHLSALGITVKLPNTPSHRKGN